MQPSYREFKSLSVLMENLINKKVIAPINVITTIEKIKTIDNNGNDMYIAYCNNGGIFNINILRDFENKEPLDKLISN